MKVLSIIGTRPEAIKMAPVIKELSEREGIESHVCSTGQHRQMLDQVVSLFGLSIDTELDIMRPNQTLSGLTSRLFAALDECVEKVQPDWILAQGDTTTVMVASMISFYRRIKFGHVEAGLRTGDRTRPFPEEINRRIADLVSDAYFAPTQRSVHALLDENVSKEYIHLTGNTVIDALKQAAEMDYDWAAGPLEKVSPDKPTVLITAHRRESFGDAFRGMCEAIAELATTFPNHQWVYPVHLNPNVQQPVKEILSNAQNVYLIEPLDYLSLVQLMKCSSLVLTDSGGIQEEAPTFGMPVLVMREVTERQEGVDAGVVELVGTDKQNIIERATSALKQEKGQAKANPYGDGKASERIVSALLGETYPSFAQA